MSGDEFSRRSVLQLTAVGAAVPALAPAVSAAEDLRSIAYGATRTGQLDSDDPIDDTRSGDYHIEPVSFDGFAGDEVTIRMESTEFDTRIRLVDPSGGSIAVDGSGGPGTDSVVNVTLQQSGSHTIHAGSTAPSSYGEYTLSLEESNGLSGAATLVEADFEDTPVGEMPPGWVANGNEDQQVSATTAARGDRSFRLTGQPDGCSEAVSNYQFRLPETGRVVFSGWIRPTSDGGDGCYDDRGQLELRTDADSRRDGNRYTLFGTTTDGSFVDSNGNEVASYDPDTWHSYWIEYERSDGEITLSYQFDDEDAGQVTRAVQSYEDDLQYLAISSADYTVYWDDIRVFYTGPTIQGQVFDDAGEPVEDATVRLPLVETDLTATTDESGSFALVVGDIEMPDTVAVIVEKSGFVPASIHTARGESVEVTLRPDDRTRASVSPELYHIGDGEYSGSVNSQFQEPVEGTEITETFSLTAAQASADEAELVYSVRGAEYDNEVSLNGSSVGLIDESPYDGSLSEYRLSVDPTVLEAGTNDITIQSGDDLYGDPDDFEVTNLRLVFDDVATSPADRYDDDGDGDISDQELQNAIRDWSTGDLSNDGLQAVIRAWATS